MHLIIKVTSSQACLQQYCCRMQYDQLSQQQLSFLFQTGYGAYGAYRLGYAHRLRCFCYKVYDMSVKFRSDVMMLEESQIRPQAIFMSAICLRVSPPTRRCQSFRQSNHTFNHFSLPSLTSVPFTDRLTSQLGIYCGVTAHRELA